MELTIKIIDAAGKIKAAASGENAATLVYKAAYEEGDILCLSAEKPAYVVAQLEDTLLPTFGVLNGEYTMQVPFAEKRVCYSPKSFIGNLHLLRARAATPAEIAQRRNLAQNPMDCHENSGLFPHATANVETRGESVFAAQNAINGNYTNNDHGPWPYESWGVNQNPNAEIVIDFGRPVCIDSAVVTLRADFPHDNWWKTATLSFSDGSSFAPEFEKTAAPQPFSFKLRTVTWAKMGAMKKDESDPSPFPALTQLEFWGTDLDG